ncbi:asparagine synthase [Permianibacter sp. IMCC34836]|uniref:asparagine synthetase B family protein n=1 Tax=Permianibacter fluminis TaxID=2738515 RepID=UPI0015521FB7|nr:asparagine synthase-related protein [Permianibacter fluminis]NQD35611.1 asparagine synthase [Permianibacter fluminis]
MTYLFGQAGTGSAPPLTAAGNAPQPLNHITDPAGLQVLAHGARAFSHDGWQILLFGDLRWRNTICAPDEILPKLQRRFARDGSACLADALGHFLLVVAQPQSQQLWLAIDRTGVRRAFYRQDGAQLLFGSKLADVARHAGRRPVINQQALYNYLYFHMVPSPDTIFQGCQKLAPGHVLHWQAGKLRTDNYFKARFHHRGDAEPANSEALLLPALESAVRRARGSDNCGAFLSGGLDSSSVVGMLAKAQPKPATFNIAFSDPKYDESAYARLSAKHFGTEHFELKLEPDEALAALSTIAAHGDEPFGNSSALPTYFCGKFARENGIKVMLAGDGGDELFAGNSRYAKNKLFEYYWRLPGGLRRLSETLAGSGSHADDSSRWPGPFGKVQSYIRQAAVPMPDRLQSYNFLHLHAPETVFTSQQLAHSDQRYPLQLWRERYREADAEDSLDATLYLDWKFTLADNDLVKVNSMCELAGIDVRYPMLDDDLIDLSLQLSAQRKLPGQKLRHYYKEACRGFLADETLDKSKHGFGLPFGVWLREHAGLRELVASKLDALKQRDIFLPSFIDHARHQHETGHASFFGELNWILMVLELWLEENG